MTGGVVSRQITKCPCQSQHFRWQQI